MLYTRETNGQLQIFKEIDLIYVCVAGVPTTDVAIDDLGKCEKEVVVLGLLDTDSAERLEMVAWILNSGAKALWINASN